MTKFDNNNRQKLYFDNIGYIAVFLLASLFLFHYLYLSIGKLPLMDFWRYGSNLEHVICEKMDLKYIVGIPHALQWNPFHQLADYAFVRLFKCDNRAYVYSGMFVSFLIILFVLRIYKEKLATNKKMVDFVGMILCVLPIINLNQWEIFTLFCNFSFMFRIFLYLLLFYMTERYISGSSKGIQIPLILGICEMLLICFASQAYFPGFVAAICFMLAIDILLNKRRDRILLYLVIVVCNVLGTLFYFLTLESAEVTASAGSTEILNFIKGLVIMLGATVIPVSKSAESLSQYYILGGGILTITCIVVFLYFKHQLWKKNLFSIACLVYAFVSIMVITYGRADLFGIASLASSRYVVETTIGLLGLVQILWTLFYDRAIKNRNFISGGAFLIALCYIFVLLCYANISELKIGPYRKEYNNAMIELAYNIDNVSDEELDIFQAPAQDVRQTINIMKKYHLSLWTDQPDNEVTYISGRYDDGWCEQEMKFTIHTNNISKLQVSYMAQAPQNLMVVVNDEVQTMISLNEGTGTFEIPCEKNAHVMVVLKSDYAERLAAPDERTASYLLSAIECLE